MSLNIHFHRLFLDGVYVGAGDGLSFRRVPPPTAAALETLVRLISERVGRALERQGLLVRDLEDSFLTLDAPDGSGFDELLGHSITYRIALGPHQGRKAFTLQTIPAAAGSSDGKLARAAGFSLHAGVASEAHEREKLEQMPCIFKCGVERCESVFSSHFDEFELCITIRCLRAANSLSVASNRPVRSFGASTDPSVSSFTAGSTCAPGIAKYLSKALKRCYQRAVSKPLKARR